MKKLIAIILILCLTGCAKEPVESPAASDSGLESGHIAIDGPMTISSNGLYPFSHENEQLNLQLVTGRYYEDWTPGPLMGRTWTGEFRLVLADEGGQIKKEFSLQGYFDEPLVFNSLFEIEFEDYNGDGNADFTIGQYGSSNGNFYKLFTLGADDELEELKVRGHRELFISATDGRYSTRLEKNGEGSFKKSAYDNSSGKQVETVFTWNGTEFVEQAE